MSHRAEKEKHISGMCLHASSSSWSAVSSIWFNEHIWESLIEVNVRTRAAWNSLIVSLISIYYSVTISFAPQREREIIIWWFELHYGYYVFFFEYMFLRVDIEIKCYVTACLCSWGEFENVASDHFCRFILIFKC